MSDSIDDLILNVLSGNATEQECQSLKDWLVHPDNRRYFEQQRAMWIAAGVVDHKGDFDARTGFNRFKHKVQPAKRIVHRIEDKPGIRLRLVHIAAMLAIMFVSGVLCDRYIRRNQVLPVAYYETVVPLGAKSQITLIDGTKVWLNAGSKLRYSTAFAQTNREVILEGEGYFEVAKHQLSFDVKTSKLKIRALGTAFNVKAYPNEESVETILVEGEVEVTRTNTVGEKNDEAIVLLKPKQRLTLMKTTDEILFESKPREDQVKEPDSKEKTIMVETPYIKEVEATSDYMMHTSWKDKRWRIEREELSSLAAKLERRYNVTIVFADSDLKQYRFNGTLEDEPVEAVLRVMAQTAPVKFELNGSEIILSRNDKFRERHQDLYEK